MAAELFDCGAVVCGRRTFDIARGWGGHHPAGAPFFVVTHTTPDEHVGPGTDRTAVTDGLVSALGQSRAVSRDRPVSVTSASLAQQLLAAGQLDEVELAVTPVLLGGGVRLFADLPGSIGLECVRVVQSVGVTHLRYRTRH